MTAWSKVYIFCDDIGKKEHLKGSEVVMLEPSVDASTSAMVDYWSEM